MDELEKRQKESIWKNRVHYSLPCRETNWNEDLFSREEKKKYVLYKRDSCSTVIQKCRKLFRNVLKPTKLCTDLEFLRFGEQYQIKACDLNKGGIYLSGLISDHDIDTLQNFAHGCAVTGSLNNFPCVRNTFTILGTGNYRPGEPVVYGGDVYFQLVNDKTDDPLYIQSEAPTMASVGNLQRVRLSKYTDTYCRFKVLHYNPQLRYETAGSLIDTRSRVLLTQTSTGQNLAVESNMMIPTLFGSEYVISCHSYKDSHRMETAENYWTFLGDTIPDRNVIFRSAKGEDVDEQLLDY